MKEIIPVELGTVVEKEEIIRYSIEYKLEDRNKVFSELDKRIKDYSVIRSGPKFTNFPKCSTELGIMIIDVKAKVN